MKILKKIVLGFLITTAIVLTGGYVYMNLKFSPPENVLTVSNEAQNIPIRWIHDKETPYAALLVPVNIPGIAKTFFMQLDSGSPVTVFYKGSLQSIDDELKKAHWKIKDSTRVSLTFHIKELRITSENFKLMDYGTKIDFKNRDAENIIGTIGTDLLEKRILVLDFPNSCCSFIETVDEAEFSEFKFTKRRILFPAKLRGQNIQLLYDSGTSSYEFITDETTWKKFKVSNGKIRTEKGNSWGKELKVISAPANEKIKIGNSDLRLKEVTHIKGVSKIQTALMRSSGMDGMTGNRLFLKRKVILDCKREKFKIE